MKLSGESSLRASTKLSAKHGAGRVFESYISTVFLEGILELQKEPV